MIIRWSSSSNKPLSFYACRRLRPEAFEVPRHVPRLREPTARIYVSVRLADLPEDQYVLLDTGAAWSVLSLELAEAAGISEETGEPVRLASRFGTHEGFLIRLPITFLAEDGQSLATDGTFFVSRDWPSPVTFLGYSGLLDSIRFALDPQKNHFYFGS